MTSLAIRATTPEIMDDADLAPSLFARVLADLARINTVTLARRPTTDFLQRATRRHGPLRILDVGYGHGDMLRHLARRARVMNLPWTLAGIDIDPRSAPAARAATDPALGIAFHTGDYRAIAGGGWDVVISNMVAHHMTRGELVDFLRFMQAEARAGWIVNDLHRHRLAYHGYPWLARLMRCHPIVRADGQLSIARGFRDADWHDLLRGAGATATLEHWAPFRLCVTHLRW